MATNRLDDLNDMFDDPPSLSASLEDFEHNERPSPLLRLPSHHSGFKSEESEAGHESVSEGPWSPTAWKRPETGSGWYRHQPPYLQESSHLRSSASPVKSREMSPDYESAREDEGDCTIPANIPLPRGSLSPVKERSRSPLPIPKEGNNFEESFGQANGAPMASDNQNNYIRFAVRAEMQHRTEPFEAAISWFRTFFSHITKSRSSLGSFITIAIISFSVLRVLTQSPVEPLVPDLVKVAGLTRSFEPLIFYSENGVQQIGALQETGVAVWDLAESVRAANLTSAPLLVNELDDLGESLKTLAMELTKFFANVDGDIDGILIVMDWAKRELAALPTMPTNSLASAFTNMHGLLSRLGILTDPSTGLPNRIGTVVTELFGMTRAQRTRQTLQRTFTEFLSVLEESINSELTYSASLFSLFATIDRQFLNLQRTTIRETDNQERLEGEFLSSLWTRVLGPNASQLRIYEKNKALLNSVRGRTILNKNLLVEHNGKLVALKQNLEMLRRRLVSPLVRGGEGSTLTVEDQIRGLDGTHEHLRQIREGQKGRVMEVLFGSGRRRTTLGREEGMAIEAR